MAFRKGSTRQLRRLIPESFFNRPAGTPSYCPPGSISYSRRESIICRRQISYCSAIYHFPRRFSHVLLPPQSPPHPRRTRPPCSPSLPSPCYAVDLDRLEANLEILGNVQKEAGCKILLAQKAFSFPEVYPQIARHLAGTTASGLYEARLGYEEMPGKEVHVYKPAYLPGEVEELTHIAGHILFNSFAQWEKYREVVLSAPRKALLRPPGQPGAFHPGRPRDLRPLRPRLAAGHHGGRI